MARKNKQHSKQFKLDAVQYVKDHPDLNKGLVIIEVLCQ